MNAAGSARIIASHYQIVVCDDVTRPLEDCDNWGSASHDPSLGFAGNLHLRLVGTEADLNDHWVEVVKSNRAPDADDWERITCVNFKSDTGLLHVMSVVDHDPSISVKIGKGDFSLYFAAQNLGVDQLSLGEESTLTDEEIAARKDLEWYRIFVIRGFVAQQGRIKE